MPGASLVTCAVDIKLNQIDKIDFPYESGTVVFDIKGIGTSSLDSSFERTNGRSQRGVVMSLHESISPEILPCDQDISVCMLIIASNGRGGIRECVAQSNLVCNIKKHTDTEISTSLSNPAEKYVEYASCTTTASLFHAKGVSTLVGYATITVSFLLVKHKTSQNICMKSDVIIKPPIPLRNPAKIPPNKLRVVNKSFPSGVGILAPVTIDPHISSDPSLESGKLLTIISNNSGNDSTEVLDSGDISIRCIQIEDDCSQVKSHRNITDLNTVSHLKNESKIIHCKDLKGEHYIEHDEITGTEKQMVFIPGYRNRVDRDVVIDKKTVGRFSFSQDDCLHHRHSVRSSASGSVCIKCSNKLISSKIDFKRGNNTSEKSVRSTTRATTASRFISRPENQHTAASRLKILKNSKTSASNKTKKVQNNTSRLKTRSTLNSPLSDKLTKSSSCENMKIEKKDNTLVMSHTDCVTVDENNDYIDDKDFKVPRLSSVSVSKKVGNKISIESSSSWPLDNNI